MISSASNTPGQPLPGSLASTGPKPASTSASYTSTQESLSSDNTDSLRSALAATPEVRPEVVEKGKQLAASPTYPALAIIESLAALITKSEDLSNH